MVGEVRGSVGTSGSFGLRLGQTLFSSASLLFMSMGVEFYSYTAFCFLVTIMGLVIPWSFTLALVDGYSVLVKCPLRQPGILVIVVVGDWVLSVLTLAAACSTASVAEILFTADGSYCPPNGLLFLVSFIGFFSFQPLATSLLIGFIGAVSCLFLTVLTSVQSTDILLNFLTEA